MKTIFLVHDLEEGPAARRHYLEMGGYQVWTVKSGDELYESLTRHTPDLVLMDILIEGPNGFEVCHRLNSSPESRPFPILLSAKIYRASVFVEQARLCGAQDYLLRPMNLDELSRRVSRAIETWEQPRLPEEAA